MKLLLAEDDAMIGASVQKGLAQSGYGVDWCRDGEASKRALSDGHYALLLLDLGLPQQDGLSVLKWLRKSGNDIPVLIITARDAVADRIAGLDLGADDYLVKPFDLDELSARIRALIRRHAGRSRPEIEAGALSLNPITRVVKLKDQAVAVSQKEFALLEALMQSPGSVISRNELEEQLYGWGEEIGSNAIEVHIHNLRRKLGVDRIRNVRGIGYVVSDD
ncbi:MAG: response regulator [Sulfuritalea sp.]|nr:response regulator [Sulfuritalea sp.]